MKQDFLQKPQFFRFDLPIHFNLKISPKFAFLRTHSLREFHRYHLLYTSNSTFKVFRANESNRSEFPAEAFSGVGDSDLPVELCHTRSLPPALTLENAASEIKEAVEKLKSNPPCSKSGILRFQVAVPTSVKALNWLLCQPESLVTFPQFHLSGEQFGDPSFQMASFDGMHGVSGIGSAVYFTASSCESMSACSSIQRYISVDSPLIRAYGFIGINYNTESSSMKNDTASFYIFIPQIELDEFQSNSFLAATLAWDDSLSYSFERAVHSLQFSLCQAFYHVRPTKDSWHGKWITPNEKSDSMEVKAIQLVHVNGHSIVRKNSGATHLQMDEVPASYPFYFRLSATITFSRNMFKGSHGLSCSLHKCANINAVWASLVVEECYRLGLKYFCIAPGSRSSPLAIAASSHPLITCISCFDERSLAFHAVGYARGSQRPAVVITSSGTAVSNLLPAVVEASQDFVPLLLLTADRPPELHDAGANQAINQVNHFGSFVRFFFNLPPPSDDIPARMVLTAVDSAVHHATQAPHGPVHINCAFREPLEDTSKEWQLRCLKGLDKWMSKEEPFTKYIRIQHFHACTDFHGQVAEVLEIIQSANQGLLIIGAIHTEDEIWAALLLAQHLSWPVVADVLSGLRFRKTLTSFPEIEKNLLFIDHLDHLLLSDSVRHWARPDVVVQIGSRITSKRIAQMLEDCSPCSYVMVDKQPNRHDPSHIVTHRIQTTIPEFSDYLLKIHFPRKNSKWSTFLQAIDMMVAREISSQILLENSLTEPHVVQSISDTLNDDAALFIGNSLVIRYADMYGQGWKTFPTDISSVVASCNMPFHGIRVAGNRGASGIDGLISTSIGFAAGCNKRVLCVVGDISFLHDTNGLAILNQRYPTVSV